MVCAASRGTALEPSFVAPLRMTTTLSDSPADTSICLSPLTSAESSMVAATTSAMPPAVKALVQRRTSRLRTL